MKLIPISEREDAAQILWDLLSERPAEANISHRKMPTWEEHLDFVARHDPRSEVGAYGFEFYEDWCLIEWNDIPVGAIYLTQRNEIGVGVLNAYQREGFASRAVALLMEKHGPRCYLANVNPLNEASKRMWEKLGFRLLQETYALEPK